MPRPIHFEIPADQPGAGDRVLQQVFGWQFQKWEGPMPYWLVRTGDGGPGIDGGLLRRAYPGQGTVNTLDVPSATSSCAKIETAGGRDRGAEDGDSRGGLAGVLHRPRGEHLRHHAERPGRVLGRAGRGQDVEAGRGAPEFRARLTGKETGEPIAAGWHGVPGGIGLPPDILELEGFARRELPDPQHHRHGCPLEPSPHLAAGGIVDRDIERRRSSLQVAASRDGRRRFRCEG